jgi:hypothetical protein
MEDAMLKSCIIDRAFSPPFLGPLSFPGALPQAGIERAFGALLWLHPCKLKTPYPSFAAGSLTANSDERS